MKLVKLISPHPDYDDVWINPKFVEMIKVASGEFPDCTFVLVRGNDDPLLAKGSPEEVVGLLTTEK
jgi:uncharacterized protein YlzI (FlbEa/FlbD family)